MQYFVILLSLISFTPEIHVNPSVGYNQFILQDSLRYGLVYQVSAEYWNREFFGFGAKTGMADMLRYLKDKGVAEILKNNWSEEWWYYFCPFLIGRYPLGKKVHILGKVGVGFTIFHSYCDTDSGCTVENNEGGPVRDTFQPLLNIGIGIAFKLSEHFEMGFMQEQDFIFLKDVYEGGNVTAIAPSAHLFLGYIY